MDSLLAAVEGGEGPEGLTVNVCDLPDFGTKPQGLRSDEGTSLDQLRSVTRALLDSFAGHVQKPNGRGVSKGVELSKLCKIHEHVH